MKLFFILSILFGNLSYASAYLGLYAKYQVTYELDGKKTQGIMEREIIQYDATTDSYLEIQTEHNSPIGKVSESFWTWADDILDSDDIETMIQYCSMFQGEIQTIHVAAGKFKTCKGLFDDEQEAGTVWIGDVSFGVVQLKSEKTYENKKYTKHTEILEYRHGEVK